MKFQPYKMYTVVLMTISLTVLTQGYGFVLCGCLQKDYCPTGWIKYKQTCYIVTDTVKGHTGELACAAIGGQLTKVYSKEINNMVSVLRKDQSLTFISIDSQVNGYNNYNENHSFDPTEIYLDCLEMHHDGKWQYTYCDVAQARKAACERPVKEHIKVDVETALICDRN